MNIAINPEDLGFKLSMEQISVQLSRILQEEEYIDNLIKDFTSLENSNISFIFSILYDIINKKNYSSLPTVY